MGAFVQALQDELANQGVEAFVTVSPQKPPAAPRFDLHVADWDPGSRFARWAIGFGAGQATMLVEVAYVGEDDRKRNIGELEGWLNGGFLGGESVDAADEAGREVALAIASGQRRDSAGRPRSTRSTARR
jgi:hypothetical protein